RRERARVVRGVTADRAAGVDHDELARADLAVAGACVWPRTGGPRADDRLECEILASLLVEELREVPRDVALRAPDERQAGEPLEDAVGDGAGAAKLLELRFVLDRAQLLDGAARRHELESTVPEHLVEAVRQHALERDSPRELVGELGDQVALRQYR